MDVYNAMTDQRHAVKLHGATKSGATLMDLAKCHLRQRYLSLVETEAGSRVGLKLKALSQPARALHAAHSMGIVLGNVKSSNFLLFDDDLQDFTIRIADLPLNVECWYAGCTSSPQQGSGWLQSYRKGMPQATSRTCLALAAFCMSW